MTNAYNTIKTALDEADLTEETRDIVLTLIDADENDNERAIADYVAALEDGQCLADLGINDEDAVEEAFDFLVALNAPHRCYVIRDAFKTCNGGMDREIEACYIDASNLKAKTAAEALSEAEALQEEHDRAAREIAGDDARMNREIDENAPCYVNAIRCVGVDKYGYSYGKFSVRY